MRVRERKRERTNEQTNEKEKEKKKENEKTISAEDTGRQDSIYSHDCTIGKPLQGDVKIEN